MQRTKSMTIEEFLDRPKKQYRCSLIHYNHSNTFAQWASVTDSVHAFCAIQFFMDLANVTHIQTVINTLGDTVM